MPFLYMKVVICKKDSLNLALKSENGNMSDEKTNIEILSVEQLIGWDGIMLI